MAIILKPMFQTRFIEWKLLHIVEISLKLVRKGPVDNKSALVHGLLPNRYSSLSELMLIKYTDRHMASLGHNELSQHKRNTLDILTCFTNFRKHEDIFLFPIMAQVVELIPPLGGHRRNDNVIITSKGVATLFWCNDDVIIASCVRWPW